MTLLASLRRMHPIHGFTLIEIAIVLVIVGLLLGGLLMPLSAQVDNERRKQTERALEEIREAIIGFAMANGRLPCPDTNGDGIPDPNISAVCPGLEGFVPWVTLNTPQGDAWNNRFRYRISPGFTQTKATPCSTADAQIGLCDVGNIRVDTRNQTTKAPIVLANQVAAVIASHGKNGSGATTITGAVLSAPPASNIDELVNTTLTESLFVTRSMTSAPAPCSDTAVGQPFCEFDDIVSWIPTAILFSRMVAAGQLP